MSIGKRPAVALIIPDRNTSREVQIDLLAKAAERDGLELVALTQDPRTAVQMVIDRRARVVLAIHGDIFGVLISALGGEFARYLPDDPKVSSVALGRRTRPVPRPVGAERPVAGDPRNVRTRLVPRSGGER